jgi:hypothetical protein
MNRGKQNRGRCWTLIFVLGLIFSGCATYGITQKELLTSRGGRATAPPTWVATRTDPDYPAVFYMTGVGISTKGFHEAEEAARLDLLKQIEVEVTGEETAIQMESSVASSKGEDQSYAIETQVKSKVSSRVHITLSGLKIGKRWNDLASKEFYALVVLNRELATAEMQRQIEAAHENAKTQAAAGREAQERGEYALAVRKYLEAIRMIQPILPLRARYEVIRGEFAKAPPSLDLLPVAEIHSRVEEILRSLKIEIVSGNHQTVKMDHSFTDQLVARVVFHEKDKKMLARSMPVIFQFEEAEGNIHAEKETDTGGLIRANVGPLKEVKNAIGAIRVYLDPDRFIGAQNEEETAFYRTLLHEIHASYSFEAQRFLPDSPGLYAWDEGLRNVIQQILRPLPAEGRLRIAVGDFREARSGEKPALSLLLEADLKSLLAYVEGVQVEGVVNPTSENDGIPIYILSGLFRVEQNGLRINALLQKSLSDQIISSARVVIRPDDFNPKDLSIINEKKAQPAGEEEYQFAVNSLLSVEPTTSSNQVSVWTDKKTYQIGEPVTFFFKSNADAYITLIDVGTSGELRLLLPNAYHPNNFVTAGRTTSIPSSDAGFSIRVDGPPGLERIKAIATQRPLEIFHADLNEMFKVFPQKDHERTRDLRVTLKKLEENSLAESYTEIYIVGDGLKGSTPARERTIKPKPKPPEAPIDIIGVPGKEDDRHEKQ